MKKSREQPAMVMAHRAGHAHGRARAARLLKVRGKAMQAAVPFDAARCGARARGGDLAIAVGIEGPLRR